MKTLSIPLASSIAIISLGIPSCTSEMGKIEKVSLDAERPNILWITCEDITPTLGCYGDTVVRTPNIDWLASQGTLYSNAFSIAGVCAPSRHALIIGRDRCSL